MHGISTNTVLGYRSKLKKVVGNPRRLRPMTRKLWQLILKEDFEKEIPRITKELINL